MKLLFLILFSMFSLESAFASSPLCRKIVLKLKELEHSRTLLELDSSQPSNRTEAIKEITDNYNFEVAEKILLHTLLEVQDPWFQRDLMRGLVNGAENHLTSQTQLTLAELIISEDTNIFSKNEALDVLKSLENPSNKLLHRMTQILKNNPNIDLKRLVLNFFEEQEKNQVLKIFTKLLIEDKLPEDIKRKIIEKILKILEPQEVEPFVVKTLSKVQDSQSQVDLIDALAVNRSENHLTNQTQSILVKLLKNEDTDYSIKSAAIFILADLESDSPKVSQAMNHVLEKSSHEGLKIFARHFLEKQEVN